MNRIPNIISLLLSLILFATCRSTSDTEQLLNRADSLINEYPDSSLLILHSIDSTTLKSESDKAKYTVLKIQGLDKIHAPLPSDSCIAEAANYYLSTPDPLMQTRALYYQGRCLYQHADYPKALATYYQAFDKAKQTHDPFWMGLTSRGIADVYLETFNASEQLLFTKLAYQYFQKSGKEIYTHYALLEIAEAYISTCNYPASIKICKALTHTADSIGDENLKMAALRNLGLNYLLQSNYKDAEKIYLITTSSPYATEEDTARLALAYAATGHPEQALRLSEKIHSNDAAAVTSMAKYHIYKQSNQPSKALLALEHLHFATDSIFSSRINQNITETVANYLHLKNSLQAQKHRADTLRFVLILVALAIILISSIAAGYILHNRQKRKLEEKILLASQLQEMLSHHQYEKSQQMHTIRTIFSAHYEQLEELCQIMAEDNNAVNTDKRISKTISNLINKFSADGSAIDTLIEEVNTTHDSIFDKFKSDCPDLKNQDYLLFLFSILGFSTPVIALLLKEEKLTSVYNRRRRIKTRILSLTSPHKDIYLSYIS